MRARGWAACGVIAIAAIGLAGCQGKLPQQDSYPAQLYLKRCGRCHVAYNPHMLTPAMWQLQMTMMDQKMRQQGIPLNEQDRKVIVDYLERNAGKQ
jgi:hypothetical protein